MQFILLYVLLPFLTVGLDVPQLVKTFKSKNVDSFSVSMLFMRWLMVIGWAVYGYSYADYLLGIVNTFCVISTSTMLYFYFKYRTKKLEI